MRASTEVTRIKGRNRAAKRIRVWEAIRVPGVRAPTATRPGLALDGHRSTYHRSDAPPRIYVSHVYASRRRGAAFVIREVRVVGGSMRTAPAVIDRRCRFRHSPFTIYYSLFTAGARPFPSGKSASSVVRSFRAMRGAEEHGSQSRGSNGNWSVHAKEKGSEPSIDTNLERTHALEK